MIFRLDPPSGYPNSYVDIKFYVEFDSPTSAEISFANNTVNESLIILSSSTGYIKNENVLVVDKTTKVDGYLNIFNSDKMNSRLSGFTEVEIQCTSVLVDSQNMQQAAVSFFNESKSLDAGIIPFDLVITNQEIDIEQGCDLELSLISRDAKKYELAIRPSYGAEICTFEAVCVPGDNKIIIPLEVLYSDLGIANIRREKYRIHYVLFQGIDFNGYVNRQYLPIDGAELRFKGNRFMPKPQNRTGPDGKDLPPDFVLSDRYLVPTWKDFSSFGRRMENVPFLCNITRFSHEVQNLRESASVSSSNAQPSSKPNRHPDYNVKNNKLFRYVNADIGKKNFYEDLAGKVFANKTSLQTGVSKSSVGLPQKGGCGCSRNK